ncbi:MAG: hypothetical protein QNJ13_09990 [Paracoccaceae bacterium]|nr:hypothetical protein [Paracoccaceae bacterium]
MSRLSLIAALAVCVASPASAQSSLGVTGIELGLGGFSQSDGGASFHGDIVLDVAVTEFHRLQGDLAWVESGRGAVGRLGGHVYMTPQDGQKYGLFAMLGDANGRDLTYAAGGIEGMFEVTDRTALGGYAGLGIGSDEGLDVIFGGVEGTFQASDFVRIDGGVQVSEYDEAGFQAIGTEARLNLRYAPAGQPFAVTAGLVHDMLTGEDGEPGETRAELTLSWRFGSTASTAPTDRPFRTADPFLPLIRRGLY